MPRRLYVIDVAVRDFQAAAETFTLLFGVSGIPMWEDYEPSGGTDGIHFQLGALDAFGLLSPRSPATGTTAQRLAEQLDRSGEGVTIAAFVAEDLDEIEQAFRARGGRFVYPEPIRVGDERLNMLELCGVDIGFAHHDPGHWERWREGHLHGAAAAPAVRTDHRVETCHSIEFVTTDLAATSDWFATIIGAEGTPGKIESTVVHPVVDFPLEGLERLRVVGPADGAVPDDPIARHLTEHGEGVRTIGLRVADPAASRRILEGEGLRFQAIDGPVTTEPIHGVTFELTSAPRGGGRR